MVEVAVSDEAPKLVGTILFRRIDGESAETNLPGRWLSKMDKLQQEGREAIEYLSAAQTERRLAESPPQFQAVNDGELFG